MAKEKQRPEAIGAAIARFLNTSGLGARVEQAQIVAKWPELVGAEIAAVTQALSVTPDGVLMVAVRSHPWMNELSMMERELLAVVNQAMPATPIKQIRLHLTR